MQISNVKVQMNLKSRNSKIKKSIQSFIICLFGSLLIAKQVLAAATPTPTESASPASSIDIEKIQRIKDIVASKVAELKLVEKRGIVGKLKENSNMHLVISDVKGNARNIDVDELTKFSISGTKGKDNTLGISDLKKDVLYSFVGLYNKDTQRLLARSITEADTIPLYFEGAISSVDSKEYQIQVVSGKGEKKNVDIQSSTKTSLLTSDGELTKSGFSKLNVNERILIIGFADTKDGTLISALRVIHFKEIPPSKEMQSHIATGSDKSASKSGK